MRWGKGIRHEIKCLEVKEIMQFNSGGNKIKVK